jgi:GNAT superfamily N-acetyltransferase
MPESRVTKVLENLRTLPADAVLGYRNDGVHGVWKVFASRSLHCWFQAGRLVVFAQPLDHIPEISPPAGIRIGAVTEADCAGLATLVGQRDLAKFRALLAGGRHCVAAWRGSQPVGHGWVSRRIGPENAIWPPPFEFPDYAAYLGNLYVLPSERGMGVGSALARARLQKARELGFREGWRMIAVSNHASLRTIQNSGGESRVVGEVHFVKLLNRTRSRFTPHAGYLGETR